MLFKNINEVKEVFQSYAINKGFNIRWRRSNFMRMEAICNGNYPWKLYVKKKLLERSYVVPIFQG